MPGLPPSTPELHVIAGYARALERRFPGIGEEVLHDLMNEALFDNVVNIRGYKKEPEVREAREKAVLWMQAACVIGQALRTWGDTVKRRKG